MKSLFLLMGGSLLYSYVLSASNTTSSEFHNQFDDKTQVELYGSYGDSRVGVIDLERQSGGGYDIEVDFQEFSVNVSQSEAQQMSKLETQIAVIDYYGKWRVRKAVHFSSYIENSSKWDRDNKHYESRMGADIGYIIGNKNNYFILGGGVQLADLENSYTRYGKKFKSKTKAPFFLTFDLHNSFGEYLTTSVVGRATLTNDKTYKIQVDSTAYLKLTKNLSLLVVQKYGKYEKFKELTNHIGIKMEMGK